MLERTTQPQTLIEKLEQEKQCWHDDGENNVHRVIDDCIDIVKKHQAESEWVSVNEPPDDDREVLLWLKYRGIQAQGFYSNSGKWHDTEGNLIDSRILSFWHEQPQPPSEVQDD